MEQIRNKIFETNSSSSHSVTISDGTTYVLPDGTGPITIESGDYGWEQNTYIRFEDRASYAYTYALDYPELQKMLKKVIKEFTGRSVKFKTYKWSGIDHESLGIASKIFDSENNLKQFLFAVGSYFETDNDNH